MSTVAPSPPVWSHSRLERPSLLQPGHTLSSISQVESEMVIITITVYLRDQEFCDQSHLCLKYSVTY